MDAESDAVGRMAESHVATIFNQMGWIPNKPVYDSGHPVPVQATIEVNFRLLLTSIDLIQRTLAWCMFLNAAFFV